MGDDEVLEQYLAEISNCTPLTSDEESELLRTLSEGQEAEKRLIESKLSVVVDIAKRYTSSGMPMFHLIQEGNVGLMKAIRRFPESRRVDFSQYAAEMIEKEIQFGISEHKREAGEDPRVEVLGDS